MPVFLLLFPLLSPPVSALAATDRLTGPVSAEVLRVIDGDTIAVKALIWPDQQVEVKVRLAKIDAPELFRPSCEREKQIARKASEFVKNQIGNQVQLTDIRLGKYAGRVIANINTGSGQDLGRLLLQAKLARSAGEVDNWCLPPVKTSSALQGSSSHLVPEDGPEDWP